MQQRGVSPIIGVIMLLGVVVALAAGVSLMALDFTGDVGETGPLLVDTAGEFTIDDDTPSANQIVQIEHIAGENVDVEDMNIIVRASGPGVDTEARLVDLPGDGFFTKSLDETDIDGNDDLISQGFNSAQIIVVDDSNTWSAGKEIEFRINTAEADFRIAENNNGPKADELEILIVHTPSDTVISEQTFTP